MRRYHVLQYRLYMHKAHIYAFEKKNIAYFGQGVAFNKYTGARGKSGTNDANAEYVAKLRRIMDDNNVAFQTAELGKVENKDYMQMLIEGAEMNETQQRLYEDYIKTHRLAERERSVKGDGKKGDSTDNTI